MIAKQNSRWRYRLTQVALHFGNFLIHALALAALCALFVGALIWAGWAVSWLVLSTLGFHLTIEQGMLIAFVVIVLGGNSKVR
jgi:hypothetical protein